MSEVSRLIFPATGNALVDRVRLGIVGCGNYEASRTRRPVAPESMT